MKTKVNTDPKAITKAEIAEVVSLHTELGRITLVKSLLLGEKLFGMRERIKAQDKPWGKWLEANIPQISQNSVNRYIRLFENKSFIEGKFKVKLTGEVSEKLPTSVVVDAALREKDQNLSRGKPGKGKETATTQERKDVKNDKVVEAYTLATFAKELSTLVETALKWGIPLLDVTDQLGAVHGQLVQRAKKTATNGKSA